MTEGDAIKLLEMIDGHWQLNIIGTAAATLWTSFLEPLDAEIATKAVAKLAKEHPYKITISDLSQVVDMLSPPKPAASSDCPTCGGNLFVPVFLRTPVTTEWMSQHGIAANVDEKIEEVAPCPECNGGANTSFRRPDGTEAVSPDPARVQELIASTTLRSL